MDKKKDYKQTKNANNIERILNLKTNISILIHFIQIYKPIT